MQLKPYSVFDSKHAPTSTGTGSNIKYLSMVIINNVLNKSTHIFIKESSLALAPNLSFTAGTKHKSYAVKTLTTTMIFVFRAKKKANSSLPDKIPITWEAVQAQVFPECFTRLLSGTQFLRLFLNYVNYVF